MEIPKVIIFNGTKYSLMGGKRKYYLSVSNTNVGRKHPKGLHVAIWEFYNKQKVPKGYHIHHKDGNTFNNDISNLQSLSCREHHKFSKKMDEISMHKHLAKIRPLAIQWHKSKKGKIWHKQHAVDIQKNLKYKDRNCVLCGKLFKYKYSTARFCSDACFQKFTRDSGKWSEKRKCIICGKEYIKKNKYQKKGITCSRTCQNKHTCQIRYSL